MNLDELQSVRDSERRTDSLQQLRESFYADAGEFIQELREERERAAERADDPFDAPEVDRLTSEINAAEETVEAIYEKRLGKLVKAASLAAADMPAGTEGMTAEEQRLFDTLVEEIRANRQHVLDVLAGEQSARDGPAGGEDPRGAADAGAGSAGAADAGVESPGVPTDGDDQTAGTVDAADAMGKPGSGAPSAPGSGPADSGAPSAPAGQDSDRATERNHGAAASGRDRGASRPAGDGNESTTAGVDRERVRITADVGAILGVDEREYDLSENDVVQLPRANAEPLLERDAAERL